MFVDMKNYRQGEETMIDKLYVEPNYYNSDSGIDINCKSSSSTFSEIENNIELLHSEDEDSNEKGQLGYWEISNKEFWEICFTQDDDGNT